MACVFEIAIEEESEEYARQAADAAFAELDRLEGELSRFIPSSDISRINGSPGIMVRIGEDALQCLEIAAWLHEETGGAFDPTLGAILEERRRADGSIADPTDASELDETPLGMKVLYLDREAHTAGLASDTVRIDLGAIGKGYALDKAAEILIDWSIDAALLHSGQSTVLALGAPGGRDGWTISLRDPDGGIDPLGNVVLCDEAASGSALTVRDRHILDPRTGLPAVGKRGTWSISSSAAISDGLSTAFMVMKPEEIADFCREHEDLAGLILDEAGVLTPYSWK